jgi:hypothetical protein
MAALGRRSIWDSALGNAAAKRMPLYRPSEPLESIVVDDLVRPVDGDVRYEELEPQRVLSHTSEFASERVATTVSPPRVAKFVEGSVGWARNGVVEDADQRIRLSSAHEAYKLELRRRGGELRRYPVVRSPIPVCHVNTVWSPRNYSHWWTFYVARLAALHRIGLGGSQVAAVVSGSALTPERLDFLRYMLPPNVRLRPISKYRRVNAPATIVLPRARELLAITIDHWTLARIREWVRGFYELPRNGGDGPARMFVTRRGGTRRRLLNEDDVFAVLARHGFRRVALEDYSTAEQIGMFGNATHVVAQHGAGLVNLLFARPGTRVLELFSGEELYRYRFLSHAAELDYSSIAGDRPRKNDDVAVSVDAIREWLAITTN